MAEDTKAPVNPDANLNPDEKPPLDEAQRLAALANLTNGTATPVVAPAPVVNVKRSGKTVDFGGKVTAVVLSRHVNETVKGLNVVARRGDLITATPAFVTRASGYGSVAKVDA